MSIERRGWRPSPISPLAYAIRMEGVRQANIYPTCRLDKSNRAVYEPEDVRAKRAALVKPESRKNMGSSKAKGMFRQKLIALTTTRVTKENMEAVDRIKETVAILMQNKERAADIGRAQRRVLKPHVAREMARMSAEKREHFEKRVYEAVEEIVYAAKRRFIRLQELLDATGIFHPEANAHRVQTQFWADLNNKVNLTKIENAVWSKMSAEGVDSRTIGTTPKTATSFARHATTLAPRTTNDSDNAMPSSKDSYGHDIANTPKEKSTGDDAQDGTLPRSGSGGNSIKRTGQSGIQTSSSRRESKQIRSGQEEILRGKGIKDVIQTVEENELMAPAMDNFSGIPGYEEVGHVPTLEEFRLEWPKMGSRSGMGSPQENGAEVSKGRRKFQVQAGQTQQGSGSVVNDLSKRDEVFRHFKKYYDKADHSGGRRGDPLFSAGVRSTGLLQPDLDVIEAVGRHTAEAQESRSHSRIGEGVISTPDGARVQRSVDSNQSQPSKMSSKGLNGLGDDSIEEWSKGDGFTNVFRESMQGSKGAIERAAQGARNAFTIRSSRSDDDPERTDTIGSNSGSDGRSWPKGKKPAGKKPGPDSQRVKGPLEGGSTSVELQARLEASWRALFVPAKLKLDFLQKYSTVERALELPKIVQLLETASKAVAPREKVLDALRRMEDDDEPMSAASIFSGEDEEGLSDLDCWVDFDPAPDYVLEEDRENGICDDNRDESSAGKEAPTQGSSVELDFDKEGDMEAGVSTTGKGRISQCAVLLRQVKRRQEAEAVVAWLRSIEQRLVQKCAEACDASWYELGETITYQGRPVASSLPQGAMETAMLRREDRDKIY